MPGIILDPRQNVHTQKKFGVIIIDGNFVAYDKTDNSSELPFLPAGWKINKNNIEIIPMTQQEAFLWEGRWITNKVKSTSKGNLVQNQGPILTNIKNYMKGEAPSEDPFCGSKPEW